MTKSHKQHHSTKHPSDHHDAEVLPEEMSTPSDTPVSESDAASSLMEELKGQLLRSQADYANLQKRMIREKAEWATLAVEQLATEILPVLDSFERGLETAVRHKTHQAVLEGFQLIQNQLLDALEKVGVTPILTENQPFDPHLHEAVSQLPSDEVPEGQILAQVRQGYKIGNKLLRPAQVVLSAGSSATE